MNFPGTPTSAVAADRARPAGPSALADYLDLAKVRLSGLVVVTAGMGYLLAAPAEIRPLRLLATVLGTFLLSGGACAVNQWIEAERDARMIRTRMRPVPAGRIPGARAAAYALLLAAAGLALLFLVSGPIPGWLGVASGVVYVAFYTPLKPLTTLNTLVGAIVGALPPLMGWAAASGTLAPEAFVLAAILFLWQIPHFLAIAWIHREDYRRGGFRMLPVSDPDGRMTSIAVVLYSLALIPVSLSAAPIGGTGWLYPVGAIALGLGFLLTGLRFRRERTREAARAVFLASLLYLPLLFLLLAFDPTGIPGSIR